MQEQHTTESRESAHNARATDYTLARRVSTVRFKYGIKDAQLNHTPEHAYAVLDTITNALELPGVHLTFTNAL